MALPARTLLEMEAGRRAVQKHTRTATLERWEHQGWITVHYRSKMTQYKVTPDGPTFTENPGDDPDLLIAKLTMAIKFARPTEEIDDE